MRNLIEKTVNWEVIGPYDKSKYRFEIDRAVIHKATGELHIDITLNFIVPHIDSDRLKALLINKLDGISGVKFNYIYKDVIMEESDIIRMFIPHMIEIVNGEYTAITKTIETDTYEYNGETLKIFALGKVATEQLNLKVAVLFKGLLKEHFDIAANVKFINNR